MKRLALVYLMLTTPTIAKAQDSAAWIAANSRGPVVIEEVAKIEIGTEVFAVDPLTFGLDDALPPIAVPSGPARFVAFWNADIGLYSTAALIFSDAPPLCGQDVGYIGVDTGTAAFLDRRMATALSDVADALEADNCRVYDCLLADQMGDEAFAKLLKLPDGTRFPAMTTGGDGGFPVVMLQDGQGRATALYADFLGRDDGEWLLPPACSKPDQ